MPETEHEPHAEEEKQCRICFGDESDCKENGRLIRPCLCKGSLSYVHVGCLQKWRNSAVSQSAFYSCPQCQYRYHFARTRIVGLATHSAVVGVLSSFLFTALVLSSSYITTYFLHYFDGTSDSYYHSSYFYYTSPLDVVQDLIRAALRILQDQEDILGDSGIFSAAPSTPIRAPKPQIPPSLIKRLIRRFLLGLPLVGAGSLVHMLFSFPLLGPVQWIARYRGNNRRRQGNTTDVAAIVIMVLIVVGAARALRKVYAFTRTITERMLLYAEDAILEVN
ncbi:hypothetical protein BJ138DRAFT_1059988 [Hygrophoropsis aurantiaca]|uniref:Uncharacterized protein n=1 Tax=Hygrophoropsis aurantiaca TaxID=72124 RepID=A0ACB8AIE0_9AGAM|nr:hypothetical protein BJ138DRAFT_1059988 [Hygrophoropsis aurantiaca]